MTLVFHSYRHLISHLLIEQDLHGYACRSFIKDQYAYELDLQLITRDGNEAIDCTLWNEGFYFKRDKVDRAATLVIHAYLTPLRGYCHNDDSNFGDDEISTDERSPNSRWQARLSRRSAIKEETKLKQNPRTEETTNSRSSLRLPADMNRFTQKSLDLKQLEISYDRMKISEEVVTRHTVGQPRRIQMLSNSPNVVVENSSFASNNPQASASDFDREYVPTRQPAAIDSDVLSQWAISSKININFFFHEHFLMIPKASPVVPAMDILSKPIPPLTIITDRGQKEKAVLKEVQSHFERFSDMSRDSVCMAYLLEMHGKIAHLGTRNWTFGQYMDMTALHTGAKNYTHRCNVIINRRAQKK